MPSSHMYIFKPYWMPLTVLINLSMIGKSCFMKLMKDYYLRRSLALGQEKLFMLSN